MAIIKGGSIAGELDVVTAGAVDAVPAIQYTPAGTPLYRTDPIYIAPVNIRQTAATAAGATVWAMRNGASKKVLIRGIELTTCFDGTAAAGTTLRYSFQRFTGANPTGGTAISIIKADTTFPASTVQDIRFLDTGLTTTGITFETDMCIFPVTASVTSMNHPRPVFAPPEGFLLVLNPNEGFAIRLNVNAVIGQGIYGSICWQEI